MVDSKFEAPMVREGWREGGSGARLVLGVLPSWAGAWGLGLSWECRAGWGNRMEPWVACLGGCGEGWLPDTACTGGERSMGGHVPPRFVHGMGA